MGVLTHYYPHKQLHKIGLVEDHICKTCYKDDENRSMSLLIYLRVQFLEHEMVKTLPSAPIKSRMEFVEHIKLVE